MRVVSGVIIRNKKLLLARRGPGTFAGFWETPGGKVETGETDERALSRELNEELGVSAGVDAFVCVVDIGANGPGYATGPSTCLFFYLVSSFVGEPEALVASELRWVGHRALADGYYPLTPGSGMALQYILPLLDG